MVTRENGQRVRANLVRRIAIARDSVRADDDRIDHSPLHQMARHAVGDDVEWDPFVQQLERRQASPCKYGRVSSA
ncbi:hypothetical protein GCM10025859_13370 [Alicyclobacillus fastidiosus]|nr:hypothetical protein GCM10025859_13370 [Alicyclobacillus fastidiosus]